MTKKDHFFNIIVIFSIVLVIVGIINIIRINQILIMISKVSGIVGIKTYFVKWEKFKNNLTTDFSALNFTELGAVHNATIGIPEKGLINFTGQIINFLNTDLDNYIFIEHNLIGIDIVNLPDLNKPAELTLYNLKFNNPRILRNGKVCSPEICTKLSYISGNLLFRITAFTNYSAEDYCGNNYCEEGEDYINCPTDCPTPIIGQPLPPPLLCIENWTCTEWSECINGTQTRKCIDLNNCGTIKDKPSEIRSCILPPIIEVFPKPVTPILRIVFVLLIVICLSVIIFLIIKLKKAKKSI